MAASMFAVISLALLPVAAGVPTMRKEITSDARSEAMSEPIVTARDRSRRGQPVKVEVYYETRCPDCVSFLNETLKSLWANDDIRGSIDLVMVPYGNAFSIPLTQVSDGYKYWHPHTTSQGYNFVHVCQHGADECFANMIQACAIKKAEQSKYMDLVFCMADHAEYSPEKSSFECMERNGIDRQEVAACVRGPEGDAQMALLAQQTNAVEGRQGTPWVLVDGKHLDDPRTLMKVVCTQSNSQSSACAPYTQQGGGEDQGDAQPSGEEDPDEFQVLASICPGGRSTFRAV
eukprot:TRINITY_DN6118_c0_g1_i2.p1 TRINITY_DN6118_c0_g1~~TRINITY_DN6118_c0_g1_i2.p1  ORF type:complete len:289 (+),score=70.22 TRINITY_DN6118_c0_g1_i2:79-945(+)